MVVVGLALGLFFGGGERAFMSRLVAASHAALEPRCESCHAPFGGAEAPRCIACHAPTVAFRIHENLSGGCGLCHQEHRGRTQTLVSTEVTPCLGCHRETLSSGRHPAATRTQCLFCHRHHATPLFARTVATDLVFPHRVHVESPGLVQAPCESCHRLTREGVLRELPKESVCRTCHFGYSHNVNQDPRRSECRLCHDPDRPVAISRAPGHAELSFSHGDHQPFSCAECHRDVEVSVTTAVQLPAVTACVRCHDGSVERKAESGKFSAKRNDGVLARH